jgi:signal transduction histidine kinase
MGMTTGRLLVTAAVAGFVGCMLAGNRRPGPPVTLRSGTGTSRRVSPSWHALVETLTLASLVWRWHRHTVLEAELQDRGRSLDQAVTALGLGMWSCDADTSLFHANRLLREELGLPAGARCTSTDYLRAIHEEDRPQVQAAFDAAWRDGSPVDIEHRIASTDGNARWAVTRANAELGIDGRVVRLRGIRMSISPRKNAELDAEKSRAQLTHLVRVGMLGQLSGALAHELNQPLTAILANAQAALRFLKRNPVDHAEVVAILEDIVSDDKRAGEVIQRLRALFVRGEARFDRVDVNKLVDSITELVHSDLIARDVTVIKALSRDLPEIAGDHVQLEQLLLNLVMNATDAMADTLPALRQVTIRTEVHDGQALLSIIDRGKGIAPDQLDAIFQPFVTTKDLGIGLGLAISRNIATAHHGRLWAEPNEFGGATLKLSLPLASDAPLHSGLQPFLSESA